MRKILFLILIILSFLAVGIGVFAQGNELPPPGITPDSPFYFLKTWKETIQTFFTFGAESKAKQFLHLADVRLAEYQKMIEKGKAEIAEKTLEKYEKQLNRSLEKVKEAKEEGKDVERLAEITSEKILIHQKVLFEISAKVPDEAKKGVENAIEVSQKGLDNAIQQKIEEGLKQASPEVQNCVKSILSNVSEKMKKGEFKGESDIPAIIQGCLPSGTKIPSGVGGGINLEFLKTIEKFYGKSLSPQDLEFLKKAQELLKDKIPQGTTTPSDKKTLNLEDVKKIQEKMQKDTEEQYKNMTPEELEYMKKMQEQGQFENAVPPEIPGDSSGGMGL